LPGKPVPRDQFERPETVLTFAELFRDNCAACHGNNGRLGAGPPLNDALFRALVTLPELEQVLKEGRPGTLMPAFDLRNGGTLTEAQIQLLVFEIKGIPYRVTLPKEEGGNAYVVADGAGTVPSWGTPSAVTGAPPLTAKSNGDWQAGLTVFQMSCANCHGDKGRGIDRPGSPRLALKDRTFLALSSDRVLRRYVITGRPDLGMPDFRGKEGRGDAFTPLSATDVADVTALLAHWRTSDQ
jgi:mono/diheme cytochrome c family protein